MDIYELAKEPENWERFYEDYSSNEHAYSFDIKKLRKYIDDGRYREVLEKYENTGKFPVPRLMMLNKKGTEKKRAVFAFPDDASWLLKFYGYYLHSFDDIFCSNLYSFRRERSVKTAVAAILKQKNLNSMYGVKLDIHDYFNSADTDIILEKLSETLKGQQGLLELFKNILLDPYAFVSEDIGINDPGDSVSTEDSVSTGDSEGTEDSVSTGDSEGTEDSAGMEDSAGTEDLGDSEDSEETYPACYEKKVSPVHKGMMAGSPLSPFLANLYLNEMDRHFEGTEGFYARYSDDIIFFTDCEEKQKQEMDFILKTLDENKLALNPKKLLFIKPDEPFEFLGFSFAGNKVDVAKASFEKIKKKLRRKARAVYRWRIKKAAEPEKAVRVYIRYFNRKFFENPVKSELTWCRWYFPIITTDASLKEIDHYMQECIRFINTGKHTKRNYNLRYEEIKKLGYRSLVNEYHKEIKQGT